MAWADKRKYSLTRTVAPTGYPLSLADVRRHCSLLPDEQDWDELLLDLLKAAVDSVQRHCGVQLMQATYRLAIDDFPSSGRPLNLPMPPLVSVSSFTVDGVAYTAYSADAYSTPGRLIQTDDSWPGVTATHNGVVITYVAGYSSAAAVPDVYKHAIRLFVAHWFANREAVVTGTIATELPLAAARLLDNASIGDEFVEYSSHESGYFAD